MPLKEYWYRFRLVESIYKLDCKTTTIIDSTEEQNLSLDDIAEVKSYMGDVFKRIVTGFAELKRIAEAAKQDAEPASELASKRSKLNELVGSFDEQDEQDEHAAGNMTQVNYAMK